MEQIAQELQTIAEILSQGQNPVWFTYLTALGPLVLTGISVFIAWIQHKQNQNLQKQIANRDASNLLRQNVLEIYNAYFNGLRVVSLASGNVADVFSSTQSIQLWAKELQSAYEQISCHYNQAKLMLDDTQLLDVLKSSFDKFNDFYGCVSRYYQSSLPIETINNAWSGISSRYRINGGDYVTLSQNSLATEEFLKLCENRQTQDIQRSIDVFRQSLQDENFDDYFKKYIRMNSL